MLSQPCARMDEEHSLRAHPGSIVGSLLLTSMTQVEELVRVPPHEGIRAGKRQGGAEQECSGRYRGWYDRPARKSSGSLEPNAAGSRDQPRIPDGDTACVCVPLPIAGTVEEHLAELPGLGVIDGQARHHDAAHMPRR